MYIGQKQTWYQPTTRPAWFAPTVRRLGQTAEVLRDADYSRTPAPIQVIHQETPWWLWWALGGIALVAVGGLVLGGGRRGGFDILGGLAPERASVSYGGRKRK